MYVSGCTCHSHPIHIHIQTWYQNILTYFAKIGTFYLFYRFRISSNMNFSLRCCFQYFYIPLTQSGRNTSFNDQRNTLPWHGHDALLTQVVNMISFITSKDSFTHSAAFQNPMRLSYMFAGSIYFYSSYHNWRGEKLLQSLVDVLSDVNDAVEDSVSCSIHQEVM